MKAFTIALGLLMMCFTPAISQSQDIPGNRAVLGWLDKVTARVSRVEAFVGERLPIGTLDVVVRSCFTRPPELPEENTAYLEIRQQVGDGPLLEVFSGWMFSSSPAVSAMDHPVYDVWLLDCQNNSFESDS